MSDMFDSSAVVAIEVDGEIHHVARGQKELRPGDGRRFSLVWAEGIPPKFLEAVRLAPHCIDAAPATPRVLWEGTLATGGRTAEEFHATIVAGPDGPAVLRRKGLGQEEVSVYMIRPEYLLRALAAAVTQRV